MSPTRNLSGIFINFQDISGENARATLELFIENPFPVN